MTICAFDITADGAATALAETPPTTGYRWLHYDLSEADLAHTLAQIVPPIVVSALVAPQTRPRCDRFEDGLILNLRGINLNPDGPKDQMVAARAWVTERLVVTVRMRKIFAIDAMRKQIEADNAPPSPLGFVTELTERLMQRARDTVFDLADRVDEMEEDIENDETPLPPELAERRRMAIRLRRYMAPQRDALVALAAVDQLTLDNGLQQRLREQANTGKLAVEELDALIQRMTAVQDHHAALSQVQQGNNSYVLSVVAAVFLPLGFVTGLFGVNVAGMPGTENVSAFAILCLSMVVTAVGTLWAMRRLKWI
ncbi:MAG: CorA family divalent cation transporter [Pseudomonadota bacterium]